MYIYLVMAYVSHIFIDLFNRSGVRLLAPFSKKDFISFRSISFRLPVSSSKEHTLLLVLVALAILTAGRSFSAAGAVRSVAKIFFKNYTTAIEDYRNSHGFVCNAEVAYFDHVSRSLVKGTFPVLNFFQGDIILMDKSRDDPRLVIEKDDIEEIEVFQTNTRLVTRSLSGSDPALLRDIPPGAFVSGTITIHNFDPVIRSSRHVTVSKGVDSVTVTCSSALPSELACIVELPVKVKSELARFRAELPENKKAVLMNRIHYLRSRVISLNRKGFYVNYAAIKRYSDEARGLQFRVDALGLLQSVGDDERREKIEGIERGFSIDIDLVQIDFFRNSHLAHRKACGDFLKVSFF